MAGALAPAMLKPQGRQYLFAPAIFSHIFCMLFLKLPIFVVMLPTENFNKQKTHRHILPIRLAYVMSKMANFFVCCDKQQ